MVVLNVGVHPVEPPIRGLSGMPWLDSQEMKNRPQTPYGIEDSPVGLAAWMQALYYNRLPKGGHFAAWEQPQFFAAELRAAFKSLR